MGSCFTLSDLTVDLERYAHTGIPPDQLQRLADIAHAKNIPLDHLVYDYFATPPAIAEAALRYLATAAKDTSIGPNSAPFIVDAGAGDGIWGLAARKVWPHSFLAGIEIRDVPAPEGWSLPELDDCDHWLPETDFLTWHPQYIRAPYPDLIVMNPPFKTINKITQAERFIRHAWSIVRYGGYIVALVRQAFVGSLHRLDLFRDCPIWHQATLVPRPSFTGNGVSDQKTEYAVLYFKKGYVGGTWTSGFLEWKP